MSRSRNPDDPARATEAALLEQAVWLRALARALVRDPDLADDLTQDTYVVALERPPRHGESPRGWLATVLKRLWAQHRRGDERRSRRERTAASAEGAPATHDVVARAAQQEHLARAVMELREPYRSTILMRFFDGFPPREIARRLGVSRATVRSRLYRAGQELRATLDAEHGPGGGWTSVVLPLAAVGGTTSLWPALPKSIGALLMKAKTQIALGALLLAGGGLYALRENVAGGPPRQVALSVPEPAPARPPFVEGDEASAERGGTRRPGRAPGATGAGATALAAAVATAEARVTGRVLDATAAPVAGIELELAPADRREPRRSVRSASNGVFEATLPRAVATIRATGAAWTNLSLGHFDPDATLEPIVVVAPRVSILGEVRDEAGRPLTGARVEQRLPADFDRALPVVLDASLPVETSATTDAEGRFRIEEGFEVDGAELVTTLAGYEPDRRAAPSTTAQTVAIRLARAAAIAGGLEGVVLETGGRPVPFAWVAWGPRGRRADEAGRFRFDPPEGPTPATLLALAPGHLPARYTPPLADTGPRWPASVDLVLGGAPRTLTGRVEAPDGRPLAGIRVWVDDAEAFGSTGEDPGTVEFLLNGVVTDEELELRHTDSEGRLDVAAFLVARAAAPGPGWGWVATDERGRFELGGLQVRDYRVATFDPSTLARAEHGPFAASSADLELVLASARDLGTLVGRVSTADGAPVAGASVQSLRRAITIPDGEGPDGEGTNAHDVPGPRATTDAQGRFELGPVARDDLRLQVSAEGMRTRNVDAPPLGTIEIEVEHAVPARVAHVRVELAPTTDADAFELLDDAGHALPLTRVRGEERAGRLTGELVDGISEVLAVDPSACWLVLSAGGREVARQPVRLQEGELSVLRGSYDR